MVHTVVSKTNLAELPAILDICLKYRIGEWFLSYLTDISEEKIKGTEQVLRQSDFYSRQMNLGINLSTGSQKLPTSLLKLISSAQKKGLDVFIDPLLRKGGALRLRKKCLLLWTSLMISPYGEVLVCPMLDRCIIGELLGEDLMRVWHSDKFREIRELSLHGAFPVCEECCVQRRTLVDQLKNPANFKRIFIPRTLRGFMYRHYSLP